MCTMADFTALPVYDGVGAYHFNRFRVVFERPAGETRESLARDFVANFPGYFRSQFANVVKGERSFGSIPTLHFHGFKNVPIPSLASPIGALPIDIDIARPHTDWVAQIDMNDNLGFTAQTLKREFRDVSEDGAAALPLLASPLLTLIVAGDDPIEINRMHFLSGRRSWRIDDAKNFEVDGDLMVLETTAVERFSHKAYIRADSALGLETAIPDIWIALLNNFVQMRRLVRVPQPPRAGWKNKNRVDYYLKSFEEGDSLGGDAEFAQQKRLRLFKTLLP
jgi:hypothetical protein